MDKKIVIGILLSALFGFIAVYLLIPPSIDDGTVRLPWHTKLDEAGRNQVFGFTLGETTLGQVRAVFGEDGKINLFETPGARDAFEAEVYFEHIYLQSLRADFVMTLDVDQEALRAMYEHGLRISQLGSGSKKVKLDPGDIEKLLARPLRSITYLPQARLDEALLAKRFGEPEERLNEAETEIVHWLYPDKGIDLARDPRGKVVIQYVNPAVFSELLVPLRAEAAAEPAPAPAPPSE